MLIPRLLLLGQNPTPPHAWESLDSAVYIRLVGFHVTLQDRVGFLETAIHKEASRLFGVSLQQRDGPLQRKSRRAQKSIDFVVLKNRLIAERKQTCSRK